MEHEQIDSSLDSSLAIGLIRPEIGVTLRAQGFEMLKGEFARSAYRRVKKNFQVGLYLQGERDPLDGSNNKASHRSGELDRVYFEIKQTPHTSTGREALLLILETQGAEPLEERVELGGDEESMEDFFREVLSLLQAFLKGNHP